MCFQSLLNPWRVPIFLVNKGHLPCVGKCSFCQVSLLRALSLKELLWWSFQTKQHLNHFHNFSIRWKFCNPLESEISFSSCSNNNYEKWRCKQKQSLPYTIAVESKLTNPSYPYFMSSKALTSRESPYIEDFPSILGYSVLGKSRCHMSEMQASLSAHAMKSAIRVSYPTTEVLCCHFPSLDESSLVPLASILYIAWKNVSQSLWLWSYHLALHLLLVPSSLLYPILKLLVRYPNIIHHLPLTTKIFGLLSS